MTTILPASLHAELTQLLQALQSTDNSIRSQAEEHLQKSWIATRAETLLMGLAEQMLGSNDASTRSFAAVMFRRMAAKSRKLDGKDATETFITLGDHEATAIRNKLLEALGKETEKLVRNKISDAVADVARQYYESSQYWPEILGALYQLSISPDSGQRETAYRVFTTTPGIIQKQHESAVLESFTRGFRDETVGVRLAAMEAFASFMRNMQKKSRPVYFGLATDVLHVLPAVQETRDAELMSQALVTLIDLAESASKMFKPLFHDLVIFSMGIIREKEWGDQCRQNALELMATFADFAPSMCRKDPTYTNDMITQCLSLMTDLGEDDDDAEEWLSVEDFDTEDSDLNHVAGEQCMDRLANKLGGATVLAPIFNWLPRLMTSMAWTDRHAALMALSAISEGCRNLMEGELRQVLQMVVPTLKDSHPRIRWAGCQALGQMSTDFAPVMQQKYHETVMNTILPVLESPEARVKSHAAAALVNFCEEADPVILEPYLDPLLRQLFPLLQNEQRYVQDQALSTIATIADAAEGAFAKFYDTLMPLMVNVLQREPDNKEFRMTRGKAMECVTLIALAVGKERLGNDAATIVQLLANIQATVTEADDPQAQYLVHSWGRMCRAMDVDFVPYLGTVMPRLLEMGSADPDVQMFEDEEHLEQMGEEGWQMVPLRGKLIGIKTSTMDDKTLAIEMLVVYAQVLGAAFAPYVKQIMDDIALPGLCFYFHDQVRYMSSKLLPQLLSCCKKAFGPASSELRQLWLTAIDQLLLALSSEPLIETRAEMYQCFYECVEVVGRDCLTLQHMGAFIDTTYTALEDYKDRSHRREEDRAITTAEEAEDEAEEVMMAIEDDNTLLGDMNKSFHSIFKNHGTAFLQSWELLMPTYQKFLTSQDPTQRQWALCSMDDVLEFCGTDSVRYARFLQKPLINGCSDASPAIRQAAAYGIGSAARYGGPAWAPFLNSALPYLFHMTQAANARSDQAVYATENACAAISKILRFNNSAVADVQAVAGQWLSTLPIIFDEEAAPHAYGYLVELINQQHPALMFQVDKVFIYVAQACEAGTLHKNTPTLAGVTEKVVQSTKALLQASNANPQSLLQQFSPEAQQIILRYFTLYTPLTMAKF